MSTFNQRMSQLIQKISKESPDSAENSQHRDARLSNATVPKLKAKIQYKTENIRNNYTNYFNASAIREEVILNFGINQNWEHSPTMHEVELNSRIILNPLAAKRLSLMLNHLVQEYEKKFEGSEDELIERASKEAETAVKH